MPLFQPSADPVDVRFWLRVRGPWADPAVGSDGCWVWVGATAGSRPPASWNPAKPWKRYGRFRFRGRIENAHRVALILFGSEPPAGDSIVASHFRCDRPLCCNPRHLRWESQRENVADAIAKRRLGRGVDGRMVSLAAAML